LFGLKEESMSLKMMAALGAAVCTACAQSATTTSPAGPPYSPPSATAPADPVAVNTDNPGTIPVGQELDVRLQRTLSSETATVEQRFEATTAADLRQGDRVLIPAGSTVHGVVSGVEKAGRVERTGRLTLAFDRIEVNGQTIPMRATATQIFESGGLRDEGETAAVGAAGGGLIGGLLGGLRGALIGAAVGAGGAIAATEGKDVTLPAGSIIRLRMDSPVAVR
jgi:hypothetical protein